MNNNTSNYTENYLIEWQYALELIKQHSNKIDSESIAFDQSLNRVLSQEIKSPCDIPHFNNSAMDGYAVNHSEISSACENNIITLDIIGASAAGDDNAKASIKNSAWKIMTGAVVPKGYDSVIPIEKTQSNNGKVTCLSSVQLGANIRKKGEDFKQDQTVAKANTIVNANVIMGLAALGIDKVKVYKKIDVAIISTGKEIIDNPNQKLSIGQLRNSNGPFIKNWLSQLPVNIVETMTNDDKPLAFEHFLEKQLKKNTHIIISTGAVSMGDFDFIPQTIVKLGGKIIFHKCKIKPGKPLLFAKFANGSYYFGLPGNPISAAIGLRFFVTSLIKNLLGLAEEKVEQKVLKNNYHKKIGFTSILKAKLDLQTNKVEIMQGQESFKIQPLMNSTGWCIIEKNLDCITENQLIDYYPSNILWG